MRAAVLTEYGVPTVGYFPEPVAGDGHAVVDVTAAGLNPLDLVVSAGRFHSGQTKLPFVAGTEGVGLLEGRRVYFGRTIPPHGSIASQALIDPRLTMPVPDTINDGTALALGLAGLTGWLALSYRADLRPGEHVLVLGATGAVGQITVQAARLLGAGRVVAVAREGEELARAVTELGADATVTLPAEGAALTDTAALGGAFAEAARGRIDVVVDTLWGAPVTAALHAASRGARIVHVGDCADREAMLPGALVRGKLLSLVGHVGLDIPQELKAEVYATMLRHATDGTLRTRSEALPLDRLAEAWERQRLGPHRKLYFAFNGR